MQKNKYMVKEIKNHLLHNAVPILKKTARYIANTANQQPAQKPVRHGITIYTSPLG